VAKVGEVSQSLSRKAQKAGHLPIQSASDREKKPRTNKLVGKGMATEKNAVLLINNRVEERGTGRLGDARKKNNWTLQKQAPPAAGEGKSDQQQRVKGEMTER